MAFRSNRIGAGLETKLEDELYQFFCTNYQAELMEILKDPEELKQFSISIGYIKLNEDCSLSANELWTNPDAVLSAGDRALYRSHLYVYEMMEIREGLLMKHHIHMRIHSIPNAGLDRYMTTIPGCDETGTFMALVGTIVKTQSNSILEFKREYVCNKCDLVATVFAPRSRYNQFPKTISECENGCNNPKLSHKPDVDSKYSKMNVLRYKDYQEVKLQEQIEHQHDYGAPPRTLCVVLQDDLVNVCVPGDDVVITGTLYRRFKQIMPNQPNQCELAFMANHVEVLNKLELNIVVDSSTLKFFETFWKYYEFNPFEGRNRIVKSFCPQIFQLYIVKLATMVVLIGGNGDKNDTCSGRGTAHMILCGDSSVGKSQLLKFTSRLIPRSIYTTGSGTTTAGLTVAAVRDQGKDSWTLEAGCLVLANGSVCLIDEFAHIQEKDRSALYEAMEQETISVAKAGMVTKIKTKCTIIAATNPKKAKFDKDDVIDTDVGLPTPLLSRFDLVILLKDTLCEAFDEALCDFILDGQCAPEARSSGAKERALDEKDNWDIDLLRSYIILIKKKNTTINPDADKILSEYYFSQRKSTTRNPSRTSPRLLESLHRLAVAHARLMFREEVIIQDAIVVISLIEFSMQSASLSRNLPNVLHVPFPVDSMSEYFKLAQSILHMLDLPDIWDKEKKYLQSLSNNIQTPRGTPPLPPSSSSVSSLPRAHTSSVIGRNGSHSAEWPKIIAHELPIHSRQSVTCSMSSLVTGIPDNFFTLEDDDSVV